MNPSVMVTVLQLCFTSPTDYGCREIKSYEHHGAPRSACEIDRQTLRMPFRGARLSCQVRPAESLSVVER